MINIDLKADEMLTLTISGADLAILIQGLGDVPHRLAAPIEKRLIDQVVKAKEIRENVPNT